VTTTQRFTGQMYFRTLKSSIKAVKETQSTNANHWSSLILSSPSIHA